MSRTTTAAHLEGMTDPLTVLFVLGLLVAVVSSFVVVGMLGAGLDAASVRAKHTDG